MAWFAFDPAHPELAPDGTPWSDFVVRTLKGVNSYDAASPWPEDMPMLPWSSDKGETLPFLQTVIGEIQPYLSGPDASQLSDEDQHLLSNWSQGAYYNAGQKDSWSPFGDPFFTALAMLGVATGGAAAFGAFAPAAAGAAGAGAGLGSITPEAAAAAAYGAAEGTTPFAAGAFGGTAGTLGGLTPELAGAAALEAAAGTSAFPAGAFGGSAVGSTGSLLSTLGGLGSSLAGYAPYVQAGTSILGSILGAQAAKRAANTQAGAIDDANKALLDFYNRAYNEQAPYRAAGVAALGQLGNLADQPFSYGSYTAPSAFDPSQTYMDPSAYAFQAPNQPLNPADYAFQAPNQPLNPADYAFTPPSGQDVLNQDPGYQFRVQQGMKALDASAAARGGLLSGAAIRGALNVGQGLASQEYGAAYNRLLGQNQLAYQRGYQQNQDLYTRALQENQLGWGRARYGNEQTYNRGLTQNQMAYERALQGNTTNYQRAYQQNADIANRGLQAYQTNYNAQLGQRQQSVNELQNVANLGMGSTANAATLSSNLGNALANNITSGGAAQAAGQIGATNALLGGLSGVGKAANSYLQYAMLQNLLGRA